MDKSLDIFVLTFLIVFTFGFLGWYCTKGSIKDLSQSDGFIIITFFWLILSIAGSIPFYLSGMPLVDSFFESMSGITTTGATVLSGLDDMPQSILFYRQLLQWMGGMGLIVLAIAVMPLLGIGGGQLYKAEIPGAMNDQKTHTTYQGDCSGFMGYLSNINPSMRFSVFCSGNDSL